MGIFFKKENNKCWRGDGETEIHTYIYTYTITYISAIKKNGVLIHSTRQMNLKTLC